MQRRLWLVSVGIGVCFLSINGCTPDQQGGSERVRHADEANRELQHERDRVKAQETPAKGFEKKASFAVSLDKLAPQEVQTAGGECFSVLVDVGGAGAKTGTLTSNEELYVEGPDVDGTLFLTDSIGKVGGTSVCILEKGTVGFFTFGAFKTGGRPVGTGTGALEIWARSMTDEERRRTADERKAGREEVAAQVHEDRARDRVIYTCANCKRTLEACVRGEKPPVGRSCGKDFYQCAQNAQIANGKQCR